METCAPGFHLKCAFVVNYFLSWICCQKDLCVQLICLINYNRLHCHSVLGGRYMSFVIRITCSNLSCSNSHLVVEH